MLLVLVTLGCSRAPGMPPAVPEGGTRIYSGDVHTPQGVPIFHYTRDSRVEGERLVSIHRSYDANTHELVVAQAARHDATYTLSEFVEEHVQLGVRSVVSASVPGRLDYTTHEGDRVRHRSERVDAPVVTGPTLFGFVRTRWKRLSGGEEIEIRFVVAEKRRSYPFVLHMAQPSGGRTMVEMRPRGAFLTLAVSPMRMSFESDTRTILSYEGRIPPRRDGKAVDARVEYEHESQYR